MNPSYQPQSTRNPPMSQPFIRPQSYTTSRSQIHRPIPTKTPPNDISGSRRSNDLSPDFSLSSSQVWSASYAGVEVYQQIYNGTAVMRRRADSYVNATQILKCAQYDKPHRTRFLEREIHPGVHEKVQGGYGKYQGTWVPKERAVALAKQLNVYDAIKYVLEYEPAPGEKPPTAPCSLESLRKRKPASSGLSINSRRLSGKKRNTGPSASPSTVPDSGTEVFTMQTPSTISSRHGSANNSVSSASTPIGYAYPQNGKLVTGYSQPGTSAVLATPETPGTHIANLIGRQTSSTSHILKGKENISSYMHDHNQSHQAPSLITPQSLPRYIKPDFNSPREDSHSVNASRYPASSYETPIRNISHQHHQRDAIQVTSSSIQHYLSSYSQSAGLPPPPPELVDFIRSSPGFDPNLPLNSSGNTYLHLATQAGSIEIVRALLERDADPCISNRDGQTPLMLAIQSDSQHNRHIHQNFSWLVEALKDSLVKRDKDGCTVVHWIAILPPSIKRPAGQSERSYSQILESARIQYAKHIVDVLHLNGQIQVVRWRDYQGRDATTTARQNGLHQLAAFLATAAEEVPESSKLTPPSRSMHDTKAAHAAPSARNLSSALLHNRPNGYQQSPLSNPTFTSASLEDASSSPRERAVHPHSHRKKHQNTPPVVDIYADTFVDDQNNGGSSKDVYNHNETDYYNETYKLASDAISKFTSDTREHHRRCWSALDEDSQHASKLLVDLQLETEKAKKECELLTERAAEYERARNRELLLQKKLLCLISLKESMRGVQAYKASEPQIGLSPESIGPDTNSQKLDHFVNNRDLKSLYTIRNKHMRLESSVAKRYTQYSAQVQHWKNPMAIEAMTNPADSDSEADQLENAIATSPIPEQQASNKTSIAHILGEERAEINGLKAALRAEKERLQKLERVMAAACGDMPVDRVCEVVQPVYSALQD